MVHTVMCCSNVVLLISLGDTWFVYANRHSHLFAHTCDKSQVFARFVAGGDRPYGFRICGLYVFTAQTIGCMYSMYLFT